MSEGGMGWMGGVVGITHCVGSVKFKICCRHVSMNGRYM